MDYRVIKEGNLFFLSNHSGDVEEIDDQGLGLYRGDTRFVSRLNLTVNKKKLKLLSSDDRGNYFSQIRLMDNYNDEGTFEVLRERFIYGGTLYERLIFTNYFPTSKNLQFSLSVEADFNDMFKVRNFRNGETGSVQGIDNGNRHLSIRYKGKDEVNRRMFISWDRDEKIIQGSTILFELSLDANKSTAVTFKLMPLIEEEEPSQISFDDAFEHVNASYESYEKSLTHVETDMKEFNQLYNRGKMDLRMLLTEYNHLEVPVAGLPWFAVPFGRDSLITCLFMLPVYPKKVKDTLKFLAHYQGSKVDKTKDEQPGKIMHEIRFGELSNTGQTPFTPYYGTIDATPLFLILLSEYFHWTNDLSLINELLPNIERAIDWINTFGDIDEDGFIEYRQEASKGFPNQGWKDSSNSIIHRNGSLAEAPIALAEVQGYVYQAKKQLSDILVHLNKTKLADQLAHQAEELKAAYEKFWMKDEHYYALALDKQKQQVGVVTSNPGHALMSGIINKEKAEKIAQRMLQTDMFNGYGIRTMSEHSIGYNPISYHNGTVWPHDNGLILLGLNQMGLKDEASSVIEGLIKASRHFDLQRLPELFCGHLDGYGHPIPYPSTCSPQAWSATTAFAILQAMLGLTVNGTTKEIRLSPNLPSVMNELKAENLTIGEGSLSITIQRHSAKSYSVDIHQNTTGYSVNTELDD